MILYFTVAQSCRINHCRTIMLINDVIALDATESLKAVRT